MILPKVTIEKTIEILREKYQFSSTGDALLILKLIEHIEQLHLAGVVRPEVESAKEGELLPESDGEANKRAGFWCQNEMYGNVKCVFVCKHCKGYGG